MRHITRQNFDSGTKVIISGQLVEYYHYQKPRFLLRSPLNEKIPINHEKQLTMQDVINRQNKNKHDTVKRAKQTLIRRINSNPQLIKALTLTFAENVTDLKVANRCFMNWVKRVKYHYPDFTYIAVVEFQKRGAVHYHLLCSLPFVDIPFFQSLWSHGMVSVERLRSRHHSAVYYAKYLAKDFDRFHFKAKRFFCSRGLCQPLIKYAYDAFLYLSTTYKDLGLYFETEFFNKWLGRIIYKRFYAT